jgi:hypothetical protein
MTIAHQAAAAARKSDYAAAASLYDHAAIRAELDLDEAKAKRHRAKAAKYARMADSAEDRAS